MAVEARSLKVTDTITRYYKEIKAEFKKITWAPREDVIKTTGIVLTTIILFTIILWLYDSVFGVVLQRLLQLLK